MKITAEFTTLDEMETWADFVLNRKSTNCESSESKKDETDNASTVEEKPKRKSRRKSSTKKETETERSDEKAVDINSGATTEPEPTDTTEPEPTDTTEPEPTDTTEPEPTDTTEPEPTDSPAEKETVETPETAAVKMSIKSVPEMVTYLQIVFKSETSAANVKEGLTKYPNGVPGFVNDHLADFANVTTQDEADEVLRTALGV